MTKERIAALRMRRQGLLTPVAGGEYDALFRGMSPVHTLYWTEPGAPPVLQYRAAFDDWAYNNGRRAERTLLKGRYQNGSVGYVDREDLELYTGAYRKPIPSFNMEELTMLDLLNREAPITINGIKQRTGMLVKKITPILHKLQQASLVFEDQSDGEGDRAWYPFDTVFPGADIERYDRHTAIQLIIKRFLPLAVCAEAASIRSFYGFSVKDIQRALAALVESGEIIETMLGGTPHYFMREDEAPLKDSAGPEAPHGVFLLHRSDFWVKSEEHNIKHLYKADKADVLYYIVADGVISGAVMGRFKFGPHVVEDVLLELPEDEKIDRREEILEAVYEIFDRRLSPVMRYNGEPMP